MRSRCNHKIGIFAIWISSGRKNITEEMQDGAGIAVGDGVLDNGGLEKAVIRASSGGAGAAQVPVHYPGNCTTSSRYTPGGGRG